MSCPVLEFNKEDRVSDPPRLAESDLGRSIETVRVRNWAALIERHRDGAGQFFGIGNRDSGATHQVNMTTSAMMGCMVMTFVIRGLVRRNIQCCQVVADDAAFIAGMLNIGGGR